MRSVPTVGNDAEEFAHLVMMALLSHAPVR
jgi:hypothetical protein